MKTKLYKSYAAATKTATTESIFVGSSDEQRFAHRAGLLDAGESTIAERSFSWVPNDKRTLRVFRLPNGDIGFRAFGSGVGDDKIASRVFNDEAEAVAHLNDIAESYIRSDKGWNIEARNARHHD